MLLQPKNLKYKKLHKGRLSKFEFKANKLKFGIIGLKSLESGTITSRQLESTRQAISRKIKKKGKLWIRVFPFLPITKKSIESRMGKGKGSIDHWAIKIKAGIILFELCGTTNQKSSLALNAGKQKLPIKSVVVFY